MPLCRCTLCWMNTQGQADPSSKLTQGEPAGSVTGSERDPNGVRAARAAGPCSDLPGWTFRCASNTLLRGPAARSETAAVSAWPAQPPARLTQTEINQSPNPNRYSLLYRNSLIYLFLFGDVRLASEVRRWPSPSCPCSPRVKGFITGSCYKLWGPKEV